MKKQKKVILACITAQKTAFNIAGTAHDLAKNMDSDLIIITVLPERCDAEKRSTDIRILSEISKEIGRDIRIIYSDNPVEAIKLTISELNPVHIFMGQGSERSQFLSKVRLAPSEATISVVGPDGILYSLPPLSEDIFTNNFENTDED